MKTYNIGAVARLTGLSVHNLRIWEKRHNAVSAVRTAGGRRVYDEAAVARLVLLKGCVDQGASIRHVAGLGDDELKATLAALSAGEQLVARAPQESLCLIGSYAHQLINTTDALGFSLVQRPASLAQFTAMPGPLPAPVLVIDEPALAEDSCEAIIKAAHTVSAAQVHVIYRFARQRDLLRLRAHDMQLWHAPVDRESLLQSLRQTRDRRSANTGANDPGAAPARRYNDEQLAQLTRLASRVECECPRHLSELIIALTAFESYSRHCEHRNADDAALHLAINRTTGKARAIMEDMLATVLKQEGIEVDG